MEALIRIRWPESVEFIPFDPDKPVKPRKTTDFWDNGTEAHYSVTSSIKHAQDGSMELRITYRQQDNQHLPASAVDWGYSVIYIQPGTKWGRVLWVDESDKPKDGSRYRWDIASQADLREAEYEMGRRLRRNSVLRTDLIKHGRVCALTGEAAHACDAAHIVGAAKGGHDHMKQAMLLRADLHRLFDAGLFDISPEGKVCNVSSTLSTAYRRLFRAYPSINPIDLKRTAKALAQRAKMANIDGKVRSAEK